MKRFLIIEKSSSACKEIVNALEDSYVFEIADNGASGLDKFLKFKPDITSLAFDLEILNGYETLCHILKIDMDAKVLMVSFDDNYDHVRKCFERGASGFLIKPFTKNQITSTIKNTSPSNKRVLFVFVRHMSNIHTLFENIGDISVDVSLESIHVEDPLPTQSFSHTDMDKIKNVNNYVTRREHFVPECTGVYTEIRRRNTPSGAIVTWTGVDILNTIQNKKIITIQQEAERNIESTTTLHNKLLGEITKATKMDLQLHHTEPFEPNLVEKYNGMHMTKVQYDVMYGGIIFPIFMHLYFNNDLLFVN